MPNIVSRLKDSDAINLMLRYNALSLKHVCSVKQQYSLADIEQKREIREQLISAAIKDAQKTTYGKDFGDDIGDWPILTKDKLRNNTEDFRGRSTLQVSAGTGGTTGQPLLLFRSVQSIAIERHFIEGLIRPFGYSLRSSRVAILRADEIKDPADTKPPFGVYRFGKRHLILSNPHLNRDTVDWYVDALKRHETEILYVYPSMLENLLGLISARPLALQVPIVLSSSETVAPALFNEVREMLGARLVDYYGLGERVALASVAPDGNYNFDTTYGRVELVDIGEFTDNGNALFRIIASGFWNKAMPLIRYDTGDIAIIRKEDTGRIAEIEIGERSFAGILGRSSEYVVGPDGSRISGLNHLPRGVGNLVRMQIVQQSRNEIEIRLRVSDDFSTSDRDQLQKNVGAMFPPALKVDIKLGVELDKSPNGKTPFVIRKEICVE